MPVTRQPPLNTALVDEGGRATQAFARYLQDAAAGGGVVGDYLVTLRTDLGASWLPCTGGDAPNAGYPALYALLHPILGDGSAAGTFKLPTLPDTVDGPSGKTVGRTWIKGA